MRTLLYTRIFIWGEIKKKTQQIIITVLQGMCI